MTTTAPLRLAVNLSILFTELPLLERPRAAKDAGFDTVEFWWPFSEAVPASKDADAFVRALDDAGVDLVGLNFFAGDMPGGERGLVSWPARSEEFRDSVLVLTDIARRTGCRAFNALYGQRLDGVAPHEQDRVALENLVYAANAVSSVNGTVLIEPLARGQNGAYPLETAEDATAVIDRARNDRSVTNLALLLDAYHLASNDEDLIRVVKDHAGRIGHVQLADAPGRNQPGTGEIDFAALFTALREHDYGGYVACEYKPAGASVETFEWINQFEEVSQ